MNKTIKTLTIINSLSVLLSALVWDLCVGKDEDFKFCDSVDSNNVGFNLCDSVDSVFCFHTQLSLILAMWFDYLCISCNGKSTNYRSCEMVYCIQNSWRLIANILLSFRFKKKDISGKQYWRKHKGVRKWKTSTCPWIS